MRGDRLLAILLLLQNHGKMTTETLAEKLEVSERTILRDMDALSAAGVPVFAERGMNGGWRLAESYRTNLTGMKAEELFALFLAAQGRLLSDLGIRKHYDGAFEKLLAESPSDIRRNAEAVRRKIHIDGAGWRESNESFPSLSIVQEAVWEEKLLHIRYAKEQETVERTVEPLGLVAKQSTWYLVAASGGELRTYRISRLTDARMLEESFEWPPDFQLAEYWDSSTRRFLTSLPRYPAVLAISEEALPHLVQRRYVKLLRSEPLPGGKREVEAEFNTLESACQILLGIGPEAAVLEPEELRKAVYESAKAIAALYEGSKDGPQ